MMDKINTFFGIVIQGTNSELSGSLRGRLRWIFFSRIFQFCFHISAVASMLIKFPRIRLHVPKGSDKINAVDQD